VKESGYYPPGTEFSKDAPWNQVEGPDLDQIRGCLATCGELEEMLEAEDALNPCLKTCRELFDEINRILANLED
jgi:hypothetical protein